jgi:hypothetical protein
VITKGGFNWRNRYNRDPGIVHLSHIANSLGAEVTLAGVSSLARVRGDGNLLESPASAADNERLLCCADGGNPNRHSDPQIAAQAYALALAGKRYTLADPVGLYISSIRYDQLTAPDGTTPIPAEWWQVTRGTGRPASDPEQGSDSRALRVELSIPAGEGFRLGDCRVGGLPLQRGAQLARLVTLHLFVTVWDRPGGDHGPEAACVASCCRQAGSPQLVLSTRPCPAGTDAFPELGRPATGQEPAVADPAVALLAADRPPLDQPLSTRWRARRR